MSDPWLPPETTGPPRASSQPPTSRRRLLSTADAVAGLITAAALVVLGAPVGLLWGAVAPRVNVDAVAAGSESAFGPLVGADTTFLLITVPVGISCGLLAWLLARHHAAGPALGLAVGGVAAALLAAHVGHLARHADIVMALGSRASDQALSYVDFTVRAHGVLLGWAAGALAAYAGLAALPMSERDPATHSRR